MIRSNIEYNSEPLPNIIFNNCAFKYDIISFKYREINFLIPRYDYERFSSSIGEELSFLAYKKNDGWHRISVDVIQLYPDVWGYENHFELKVIGDINKVDDVEMRDIKLGILIN